jgi:glycine/D-amino acid oxidase-like deaminating enzyme
MKTATIVGGGIFGVAAADMLHRNGYDVTVVDHRGIGQGTTSQSTEMLRLHHSLEHELWCTLQTLQFVKKHDLVTQLPYLFAYYEDRNIEDRNETFERINKQQELGWKYGIDIFVYDQEESLKRFPFLKKQVQGNFLLWTSTCIDECRIGVSSLVHLLFESSGAKLIRDRVLRIEENGDILTVNNGILNSDIIIIAAGPWTGPLVGNCGFGDYVDITPVPYYTIKASAPQPIPYMVVLPGGLYLHPEHPELPAFAVGGISSPVPSYLPKPLSREFMENHIIKFNQFLANDYHLDPRCEQLTAGCYDLTPSHSLLIERSNINPKITIFAGGNGHGIMMCLGAALLLELELGLCIDPEREAILLKMRESSNLNPMVL